MGISSSLMHQTLLLCAKRLSKAIKTSESFDQLLLFSCDVQYVACWSALFKFNVVSFSPLFVLAPFKLRDGMNRSLWLTP